MISTVKNIIFIICVHLRMFNITYLSYKDKLVGLLKKVGALKKGGAAAQTSILYIYAQLSLIPNAEGHHSAFLKFCVVSSADWLK